MRKSLALISVLSVLTMLCLWAAPVFASPISGGGSVENAGSQPALPAFNEPHSTAHITAAPMMVPPSGGTVTLTITLTNDGNTDLLNAHAILTVQLLLAFLDTTSMGFSSNQNIDSTLGIGETWTWIMSAGAPTLPITYTARNFTPATPFQQESVTITAIPTLIPASSNWGMGLLVAGLAITLSWFVYRRTRRTEA